MKFQLQRNPYIIRPTKKEKQKPAELLRVETREVHGQMVEVQIWSPGPSPIPPRQLSAEELEAVWDMEQARARSEYKPQFELSRIGLPVQK